jgi:hypothetical protein
MDHGRAHGPPWTEGGVDRSAPGLGGALIGAWPPPTPGHESSSARAPKREGSVGNPSRASPELGWWCGGRGR